MQEDVDMGFFDSIKNQVELCKEYVRVHFGDAAVDKVVVYETLNEQFK